MQEIEQNGLDVVVIKPSAVSLGLKMGIITALVYVVLLLLRYVFFSYSPVVFSGAAIVSYLIILGFYLLAARQRKKELGEYSELRDVFSTVFVVILITEIVYAVFNYFYLNFIDPEFLNRYMQSTLEYLKSNGGSLRVQHQIEEFQSQKEIANSLFDLMVGLLMWLIIDSILGLLISLIFHHPKSKH